MIYVCACACTPTHVDNKPHFSKRYIICPLYKLHYPVAKMFEAYPGVVTESVSDETSVKPSSSVLQGLWQIPVIERHNWLYVGIKQRINKTIVVFNASVVGLLLESSRLDAGPRNRESIVLHLIIGKTNRCIM